MSTPATEVRFNDFKVSSGQWELVVRKLLDKYSLHVKDITLGSLLAREFEEDYPRLECGEYLDGSVGGIVAITFDKRDVERYTQSDSFLFLNGGVIKPSDRIQGMPGYRSFLVFEDDLKEVMYPFHVINTNKEERDVVDYPSTSSEPKQSWADKGVLFSRPCTEYPKIKETVMTTRNLVNVSIIDPSAGILPDEALIVSFGERAYDGNKDNLKLSIAFDGIDATKLREALTAHNKKRGETINLDILNRTGNKVMLEPLRITEVEWVIR